MLKLVIAAAFRAKGKRSMTKSDLTYFMSFNLKWFTHDKSKSVVEKAIEKGLLIEEEGKLKPSFDIYSIKIPVNFEPDLSTIDHTSLFEEILEEISIHTGLEKNELISKVNSVQEKFEGLLDAEVVALIVAKEYGMDVSKYLDSVEKVTLIS
ncbi:MAG: DUF2240 domain-containing protein [Archaeoglobus sp.]|nr:MAG: DUF2240 domain-containing protein [Archaeoglobus sp.]